MKKTALNNLNLTLYEETLENGLRIYVVPMNDINNTFATFSTDYGSVDLEFTPIGEKKMIRVPNGIAHFLEHKCFEQKDGVEPFTFFGQRGCDANANTSFTKTTYLFSGTEAFEESFNYLLNYVQSPYFTEENVEKEKGIIEQEIKMYDDEPDWKLQETSIYNAFIEDPIQIPIAGTVPSIKKITKDDLYTCYNTFYHPSNMYVVVVGNVDANRVVELARENQNKKEFPKPTPIKRKRVMEPEKVRKEKETLQMNVSIPKAAYGYKIKISDEKKYHPREILSYLLLYFDIKIGTTSSFYEAMQKQGLLTSPILIDCVDTDDYLYVLCFMESKNPHSVIDAISKEISTLHVEKEDLERKKKKLLSNLIRMSERIEPLNEKIMSDLNKYHRVVTDDYEEIKKLSLDGLSALIHSLSFEHTTSVIIEPNEKK